jgi:hypothetical protein
LQTLWCKLLKILTKTADRKSAISHVPRKEKKKKTGQGIICYRKMKNQVLGDIFDSDPSNDTDLSISG